MAHTAVPAERRMANDIAKHHAHLPADLAAEAIAGHLTRFWDPRMRERLLASVDQGADGADGADGFDPLVLAAVKLMR
ncbi:formate dehydrogenase subunit delta [Streptomyces sp. NPDC050400]|uniref:formate dehydrogenase subunit delta n=1 Tax=Streptomyces sp. NPDC050400 TaxID=3365610 RepID=UPI0037AD4846